MSASRPNWFVALPVRAGDWFAALPAPPPATRLFAAEDLHVTVAFLGAVGERAACRAFDGARAVAPEPVLARLGPVRAFGSKRHPSALSAVIEEGGETGGGPVSALIGGMRDRLLESAGARPDRRPPRPHVTLARISRRARPEERRAALAWAASVDLDAPEASLDRLALYTWGLDRHRSLFRIVDEFALVPGSRAAET